MKYIYPAIISFLFLTSCNRSNRAIVNVSFIDSLVTHYSISEAAKTNAGNLEFWKKRMDSMPDNFLNGPEYAASLSSRFRLYGNLHDLLDADSLFLCSNEANREKEPGIFRTLASFDMLRHRFHEADIFLHKAIDIEGRSVPNEFLDFDISFEMGREKTSRDILSSLQSSNPYGYSFRRSKLEHYSGSLDSSIAWMNRAAGQAGNNKYLRQVALSNAGDLYIHKGDLKTAYTDYVQSIKIDAADFHSLLGIGWIALVHDKNDSLAQRIFQFVRNYNHSPDPLLKLEEASELTGDLVMQKKYANDYIAQVSDSSYGLMYSKYLIDMYTGILNNPAKAVALAQQETTNRPTPQVYAWYAWSLFCNNEKDKAYSVFKGGVSGRPLEGLELYYMGRMMQGLNKGYNAQQFFKAADKNLYDLSPAKAKYLKENLE